MRAKQPLRRSSLLFSLVFVLAALAASPGQSQPHHVIHRGPVIPASVSVFFGGSGGGTVKMGAGAVASGAGCAADCTQSLGSIGSQLTLTATPGQDSLFAGWGGDCSGTSSTCRLTAAASTRVLAYFRSNFRQVTAGQLHTCALRPADGSVTCWGRNDDSELGIGNVTKSIGKVTGISNAVAIAAGGFHTCALLAGGSVACWGFNKNGQIGTFTFGADVDPPLVVRGINDAVALTAGGSHSCVVRAGGAASCWGSNSHGQLGNGTTNDSALPVAVNLALVGPLTHQIAAGGYHTCAILAASSRVACWGGNNVGQLGIASRIDTPTPSVMVVTGGDPGCPGSLNTGCVSGPPAPIAALTAVSAIAASIGGNQGGFHSVALDSAGLDWGWGNNNESEINPNFGGEQDTATRGIAPSPRSTFIAIAAGANHTCMLAITTGVFCRGDNHFGQSGPTPNSVAPASAVPMTLGVLSVATGGFHTCAVVGTMFGFSTDPLGSVMCWGDNDDGQVLGGTPTRGVIIPVPFSVPLP